ncbi:hypothetical protein M501DRAFT_1034232 [Patellaria atrata CBS 101060]|uniref:Uncharacterized protein n=1 Tax=Patellaria atrata CBS 101060 TaxID=1346257 RepID=A0A9P4S4Z2_9PEZI|nr:hypothetical protein M501DRAFT_1034232 [Patellaria atrata CBS 101060]
MLITDHVWITPSNTDLATCWSIFEGISRDGHTRWKKYHTNRHLHGKHVMPLLLSISRDAGMMTAVHFRQFGCVVLVWFQKITLYAQTSVFLPEFHGTTLRPRCQSNEGRQFNFGSSTIPFGLTVALSRSSHGVESPVIGVKTNEENIGLKIEVNLGGEKHPFLYQGPHNVTVDEVTENSGDQDY